MTIDYSELINNYDDIVAKCKESGEPIFITKDDKVDLVVMDVATYEKRIKARESLLESQIKELMVRI